MVINSGFFKKHHCFFLEFPQNVRSWFAVFRRVPNIIRLEDLNGWKSDDESSVGFSDCR